MLRIVYSSRAEASLSVGQFQQLHLTSAANNWTDNVTGLLLYDGYRFLQAIEGHAEAVDRCYARIEADPRHHSLVVSDRDYAADRQFGDWSPCALDLTGARADFRQRVMAQVASVSKPDVRAAFIGFAALAR